MARSTRIPSKDVSEEESLPFDLSLETLIEPPLHKPLVVIVGRPNVGKSTLFNRIVGHRTAIVDDVSGVTRDRNMAECEYQNRVFTLMDTGGLDLTTEDEIVGQIRQQTQMAIAEADLVIGMMDGRAGLTPLDADLATLLRPVRKPVFLAVNKIDTPKTELLLADFYQLGAEKIFPISAEGGLGVDELLEALLPHLPVASDEQASSEVPRVAVVGRPNVGKSTLVNRILGEQRLIVSDIPGTTRDPIDSMVTHEGRKYIFTDTAGLRRRGRIDRGIEGYSVARAIRALGRSDVAVLLLDGVEGVTEQDTKIAGLISKQGRGCTIIVRDPSNENAAGGPCAFARACFFNNPRNEYPLMSWNEQNVLGLRPFRLPLGPFKSPSPVLGEERLRDERTFHNDTSISPSMAHTIDFNKPFPKLFVPYQNSQRGTRKSELCSDGIFQIA